MKENKKKPDQGWPRNVDLSPLLQMITTQRSADFPFQTPVMPHCHAATNVPTLVTLKLLLEGLPLMMSAKVSDFLTPSPHCLHLELIHTIKCTQPHCALFSINPLPSDADMISAGPLRAHTGRGEVTFFAAWNEMQRTIYHHEMDWTIGPAIQRRRWPLISTTYAQLYWLNLGGNAFVPGKSAVCCTYHSLKKWSSTMNK